MTVFDPTTHQIIALPNTSTSLSDSLTLDARDHLARMLLSSGLCAVTPANTPPTDADVLWYHTDLKQFKRYDAVNGVWAVLQPNQFALNLTRRAVLGAALETTLETGDLFLFWDVSVKETKRISREGLIASVSSNNNPLLYFMGQF